jgi:uncharacterized membrane protein YdbT with pleckstrin-like domain
MARMGETLARAVAPIWEFFVEIAVGIVVLWLFFLVMGGVSLGDPLWLTILMGALAIAAVLHIVHVHRVVDENPDLARRAHMMREHRGF